MELDGAWLDILMDPDHIDATVAAIVAADEAGDPEPVELVQARRQCQRLERQLDRMLAAIRAGMDPALAAGQTRKIQADIAAARSTIRKWERSHATTAPLSEREVRDALTAAGGLVAILASADRTERAALYRALGLKKNKLQPARNASTSGWSYVVAGAGFEAATFGL